MLQPFRSHRVRRGDALVPILVLVAIAALGAIAWYAFEPGTASAHPGWLDTVDAGFVEAGHRDVPVMIMFTADWCGPCQFFKKNVFGDAAVAETMHRDYVCVMVDLSERGSPNDAVAREFGVRGIPSLHIYDADGYERAKYGGPYGPEAFLIWLEQNR